MLARIPRSYRRAILSNSNALHWPRVLGEMRLGAAFDSHFVSHLTGRIKPDSDAFEHVVDSLGCLPAQVLFLDDNALNVEAAQRFGMHAIRVCGDGGIGPTRRMAWLTKARFLSGLQCHKRLWFEIRQPLGESVDPGIPILQGRALDEVVQRLHPGVVISRAKGMPSAIAETK